MTDNKNNTPEKQENQFLRSFTDKKIQELQEGFEATNSTFNGWTSYAKTLGDAKFVDCSFGEGAGYAFCRPYAPTEFVGIQDTFTESGKYGDLMAKYGLDANGVMAGIEKVLARK